MECPQGRVFGADYDLFDECDDCVYSEDCETEWLENYADED